MHSPPPTRILLPLSLPHPHSCTPRVCFTPTQSSLHQRAPRTLPHTHLSPLFRTDYDAHVPPIYQVPFPYSTRILPLPHFASVIIHCSATDSPDAVEQIGTLVSDWYARVSTPCKDMSALTLPPPPICRRPCLPWSLLLGYATLPLRASAGCQDSATA